MIKHNRISYKFSPPYKTFEYIDPMLKEHQFICKACSKEIGIVIKNQLSNINHILITFIQRFIILIIFSFWLIVLFTILGTDIVIATVTSVFLVIILSLTVGRLFLHAFPVKLQPKVYKLKRDYTHTIHI